MFVILTGFDVRHDCTYRINARMQQRHVAVAQNSGASAELGFPTRIDPFLPPRVARPEKVEGKVRGKVAVVKKVFEN